MKQKNVLAKNMIRFNTKNLVTEGLGDIAAMVPYINDITKLISPAFDHEDATGQKWKDEAETIKVSDAEVAAHPETLVQLGKEIKSDIEKPGMFGTTTTASARINGVLDSTEKLERIIKKIIYKDGKLKPNAEKGLNLGLAKKILTYIVEPNELSPILTRIGEFARKLGVTVSE